MNAAQNTARILPDLEQARRFLSILDEGAERFTFQTFDDLKSRGDKSLARVLHGTIDQHFAELARLNARGAGVFVMVQAGDFRGRAADNVVRIRDLYQENDGEGKALPLEPHVIVETSSGKDHKHLLCDGIEVDEFDDILRTMIAKYGSDPEATGRNRVLRLPGFFHMKNPTTPHQVRITHESGALPYTREQILAAFPPSPPEDQKTHTTHGAGETIDVDARTVADLRSALNFVRADDRKTWIANAYRLHELGEVGRELWLTWSQTSYSKFDPADAAKTWDNITKADRTGYAAVFAEAQAHGWVNPAGDNRSASESPEPEPAIKIASLDWSSCARRAPPPFEWVIPHWLSLHPALWAGRGGIGKTLLAQTAGTALATQRPFIGDIARPYTAGVFACEDDADELQRRQANINAHFGLDWGDLDRLHVAVREGQPNVLFEPEFGQLRFTSTFELLRQWVNDLRIEVLFIDNVSQVYAGPAGDNGAVTRFVNGLRGIWRDFKGAPVLLAHPARATGSEFSGAAAWENAVRMRWWLGDTPPDMPESDAEPSTTVRYLAKRKANYTDRDLMRLNFIDGVLVPETIEPGTSGAVANLENAKAIVVDGMRHLLRMNQQPSDKPGANYLPKLLIDFKLNGNHQKKALVDAMHALMTGGVIERCVVGKYANRNPRYGLRFMQKECPW